ncbi:hypothetical protein LG299_04980 [Microbacterium lacus]|uniref:thermonuclease family protein n=1 Tax=Microbacterium lacus TaxID=415217 RepID=UPI00384A791E
MRRVTTLGSVGLAVVVMIALAGCAPDAAPTEQLPTTAPSADAAESAETEASVAPVETIAPVTFVSVIDGDTIETSVGTVRIIGIDTPERGECGDNGASAAISAVIASGDPVTLELPAGQNDQDQHGRLVRYVTTPAGVDLGLLQLQSGNAVARYDSRDGYPQHPREENYHASQLATLGADGLVVTVDCQALALAPVVDTWWTQYSSCTKLKKNDVGHPVGPFNRDDPAQSEIYQWFAVGTGHGGDGDGDGLACE